MIKRILTGFVTALAMAGATGMLSATVALADTHTITYDMTGAFVVTAEGTSSTVVETASVEDGTEQTIREAPQFGSGPDLAGTIRLDPCGGSLPEGHSGMLAWGYTASYSFTGWNTAKDGRGASFNPGDTISVTEDTTLYVQFATQDIVTMETLPEVAREGYAFDGWYTAQDGGVLFGYAGDKPDAPVDTLQAIGATGLYAHWVPASEVAVPDTAKGDLMATGALRPDVTPILMLFLLTGLLSGGFAYLARRK